MNTRDLIIEGVVPLFGMLMSFVIAGVIVLTISRARTRRLELQAEIQSKLIDKFGSTAELANFLQSEAGRQFVSGVQNAAEVNIRYKIHAGVRNGILFSALGIAFLILWPLTNSRGLVWPGVFMLMFGISFFGTAWSLSRYSASRQPAATGLPATSPTTEV